MAEKPVQNIKTKLKCLINETKKEWDKVINIALFALRSTELKSTKFTSAELLYGRKLITITEIMLKEQNLTNYNNYVTDLQKNMVRV